MRSEEATSTTKNKVVRY